MKYLRGAESFNTKIEHLKDALPISILNNVKTGDWRYQNKTVILLIKHIFKIYDDFDDQIELNAIYDILQDELVLEIYFTTEYIKNFKANPQKYATAKCINYMSLTECGYIDEYVLLAYHQLTRSYVVFYITYEKRTCFIESPIDSLYYNQSNLLRICMDNEYADFILYTQISIL